ncbi:MAG: hypothetical protein EAZ08_03270 [Cytophagales bacterium]|nr:MAG: hypothetical protein EAZ08_03270 [Cytophagales bacterium]
MFAGGMNYYYKEVASIIYQITENFKNTNSIDSIFEIESGIFSILKVHESWSKLMALGVYDYFNKTDINIFQILPNATNLSLDIPDMSLDYDLVRNSVWQYLKHEWQYSLPEDSKITTNTDALFGKKIKEIARWEINEWEGFTENGNQVDENNMRVLPLSVILSIDTSMMDVIDLGVGKGIWRDESSNWTWIEWG